MLLQSAGAGPHGTLPPPDFHIPPWTSLARTWDTAPQPKTSTVTLGPATITLGHDDIEAEDEDPEKKLQVDGHAFGWDNESPKREVHVEEFRIEWRPVTNGQFYDFWRGEGKGKVKLPKSWIEVDGEVRVRLHPGALIQGWKLTSI
jgi:formylglycine-generating enzyme required for sulfatase activity